MLPRFSAACPRALATVMFVPAVGAVSLIPGLGDEARAVPPSTWSPANGGGYVVVIRHSGGMRSTCNHNSKVLVEVGEAVERGQTIALVGSTGWSTGPHLDVRIEIGRFVNPMDIY